MNYTNDINLPRSNITGNELDANIISLLDSSLRSCSSLCLSRRSLCLVGSLSCVSSSVNLPWDALKECSPDDDEEAFIEVARVWVNKCTYRPSIRPERKTSQTWPGRSSLLLPKRERGGQEERWKESYDQKKASVVTQRCTCHCTRPSNLLVGDLMVGKEKMEVFLPTPASKQCPGFSGCSVQEGRWGGSKAEQVRHPPSSCLVSWQEQEQLLAQKWQLWVLRGPFEGFWQADQNN